MREQGTDSSQASEGQADNAGLGEEDGEDEVDPHGEHDGEHDGAGTSWSEASGAGHCLEPQTRSRKRGGGGGGLAQTLSEMPTLPLNVGTMSIASWDVASEPTVGTDAGTDHDVAAASGIPEGEGDSDDEEEEDDMFEVADSLDLGAVALCVSNLAPSYHLIPPLAVLLWSRLEWRHEVTHHDHRHRHLEGVMRRALVWEGGSVVAVVPASTCPSRSEA